MKKTKTFKLGTGASIVGVILCAYAVLMVAGFTPKATMDEEIEETIKTAELLITGQECIINSDGSLDKKCLKNYRNQLEETFTKESKLIDDNYQIMKFAVDNFDDQSDVVMDNQVIDLYTKEFHSDGDKATATVDLITVQKYISYFDGNYDVVLAAGVKTLGIDFQKNYGKWKISKYTIMNYVFGSPEELKLPETNTRNAFLDNKNNSSNHEKTFYNRSEAISYASSLDLKNYLINE